MPVRALVGDLFAEHLDRITAEPVRLQVLVSLLEDLGIVEPTTRETMAALRRDGAFTAVRSGRETLYSPTEQHRAARRQQAARLQQRLQPWDGRWRMVIYSVPETDRATRERVRRILGRHGFGMLAAATWISPQEAALEEARAELATEPLARLDVLRAQLAGAELLAGDVELAHRCWDLDTLAAGYEDLIRRFRPHLDGPRAQGAEALRLHLQSVQALRSAREGDPFLPPELRPPGWPGRTAVDTCAELADRLAGPAGRYVTDRLGESDVPLGTAPAAVPLG